MGQFAPDHLFPAIRAPVLRRSSEPLVQASSRRTIAIEMTSRYNRHLPSFYMSPVALTGRDPEAKVGFWATSTTFSFVKSRDHLSLKFHLCCARWLL